MIAFIEVNACATKKRNVNGSFLMHRAWNGLTGILKFSSGTQDQFQQNSGALQNHQT